MAEAVARRCCLKKVFLKICKIHRKSSVPEPLFLIKLQAEPCNFIKKETLAPCFPLNFAKFFKKPCLKEQNRWLLLKYKVF